MAFPVIEATSVGGTTNTTTSFDVNLPSGTSLGDLIVISVRMADESGTFSTPSGWNKAAERAFVGTDAIFFKELVSPDSTSSVTITFTGPAARTAYTCYRITGFDNSVTPVIASFVGNINPPNLNPGWGSQDILWIAGFGAGRSNYTSTPPTNYTNLIFGESQPSSSGDGRAYACSARRFLNASSEDPDTFSTTGGTGPYQASTFTLAVLGGEPEQNTGNFFAFM